MISIEINEEVNTKEDMVYLLEDIARQLRQGNTSGVSPSWSLNEEETIGEETESNRSIADIMDDDSDNTTRPEETY